MIDWHAVYYCKAGTLIGRPWQWHASSPSREKAERWAAELRASGYLAEIETVQAPEDV